MMPDEFAVGREGVVDAHRGIEHGLGVVQFIGFAFLRHDSAIFKRAWMALAVPSVIVQPLQRCPDARTQVEAAVLGVYLEAGVEGWGQRPTRQGLPKPLRGRGCLIR